jgi:NADH-quinone oxidoreductase subunit E
MTREEIIKKYKPSSENLLSMLHDLQDSNEENYLTEEDLKDAAEYMNIPYTLVHGVATFYSMYSMKPRGKNIIRVCQSPPCHLMGSTDISKELMKLLGIKFGETTPCKTFTLEMSSCLGVCGVAPAIMIDDRVYGNLTTQRLKEVIQQERRA